MIHTSHNYSNDQWDVHSIGSLTSIQGFLSWLADVQALTMPWLLRRASSGRQRWRPRIAKCTEEAEICDSAMAPPSIPNREIQPAGRTLNCHHRWNRIPSSYSCKVIFRELKGLLSALSIKNIETFCRYIICPAECALATLLQLLHAGSHK